MNQYIKQLIHDTLMGFVTKIMMILNCTPLSITIVNTIF